MSDLLDLVNRCEKAAEPDRELDGLIYRINPIMAACWPHWSPLQREEIVPRYTASLDAAMTLVPEGWAWRLDGWRSVTARVFMPEKKYEQCHRGDGKVALALCTAALRARRFHAVVGATKET